ncbi:hypothetical protein BO94DRAFT_560156 [Aspergillus sclerotioniger CBS 115572]|uniref:Uncharacterized protein n=1 Tax=Aspergillus sclerotioniger CBS 115572 TaxID=1450535 RepID=A0A317VH08_9EURO|nr:hypothetical protein BO94DRAFT_560156 [Aspergillus sclerotioniger CBS 115572]PWY72172.1 hypothetical protein BO94DRAFT_560156 [Aspergillus sclerotioniger CBS 115572]
MESENESSETWEVPIMLSPDYEELARFNPFFDKIMDLWSKSAMITNTMNSSDASASTSPSQSMDSGNDSSFNHRQSSTSPLLNEYQSRLEQHVSEQSRVELHHSGRLESDCMDSSSIEAPLGPMKTSHKKLFGENGWLGCTADMKDLPSDTKMFKGLRGFGRKIKKQVEELAEEMAKAHPNPLIHVSLRPRIVPESTIPISLDPPTQAKLYSEMEVMICVTANKFLLDQYNEGRLSEESIRKVTKYWGSKNRPQVIEFQFDQATQRRLIMSNIRTLRFSGEFSTNPVLLKSNLNNWKAVSKEMSVRTFCAPDSAIRKHMHDIHKILDMLDAPLVTYITFEELQMRTLSLMKAYLEKLCQADGGNSKLSRSSRNYGRHLSMAY